jgi:hypothetical protein
MSANLAEVIAQLHLKPGQTYRTIVNGHLVDIRMHDTPASAQEKEEPSQFADGVMLQPWFDMPEPTGGFVLQARPGLLDLPDLPLIPPDDEEEG